MRFSATVALGLLALASPAIAAETPPAPRNLELVLPFPEAFLKRIPDRNVSLFPADRHAFTGKACAIDGSFVWSKHAKEFLEAFAQGIGGPVTAIRLHLLTLCDPAETKTLLDGLLAPNTVDSLKLSILPAPSAGAATSLATTLAVEERDVARVDYPYSFASGKREFVKSERADSISFVTSYYEYPSFEAIDAERQRLGANASEKAFPATREAWEEENDRLAGILQLAKEYAAQPLRKKASFSSTLQEKFAAEPTENFAREGAGRLAGTWKPSYLDLSIQNDPRGFASAEACGEFSARSRAIVRTVDFSECLAIRKHASVWILEGATRACREMDLATRAVFPPEIPATGCGDSSDTLVIDSDAHTAYAVAASRMKPEYCTNATVALESLGLRGNRYRDLVLARRSVGATSSCEDALRDFYGRGRDFRADEIAPFIVALKDLGAKLQTIGYADALIPGDYDFFHYTDDDLGRFINAGIADRDEAYAKTRSEKGFENIFNYVKSRGGSPCCQIGVSRGFYVAADPESSKTYGSHQLKFTLDPDTKVVIGAATANLGNNGSYSGPFYDALKSAVDRLVSGQLGACPNDLMQLLVLEDSGVQLVLSNFGYESQGKGPWFFLLNSGPIRQACFR